MIFLVAKQDIKALIIVFGFLIIFIFLIYLTNRPKKEKPLTLDFGFPFVHDETISTEEDFQNFVICLGQYNNINKNNIIEFYRANYENLILMYSVPLCQFKKTKIMVNIENVPLWEKGLEEKF
ncbi:MAG: hypothetical protein KBD12_02345 [Candidatus Pacebacteria bacterium]|nr:hypothetical protein [Candidatus Paceibacterota bacterium]